MEQEKLQNHYGTQMVLGAKAETGCKGFPGINFTTTTTIFGKKNEIPFSKGEEAGSQKEQEKRTSDEVCNLQSFQICIEKMGVQ